MYLIATQEEMQYYLEHTFNMNYIESGPVNQPARNCEALEAVMIIMVVFFIICTSNYCFLW